MRQRNVQIEMEEPLWALFEHFMKVMEARGKKLELPHPTFGKTVGAVLTKYLLAHETGIRESYAQIHLERAVGSAKAIFGPGLSIAEGTFATRPSSSEDARGDGSHSSSR